MCSVPNRVHVLGPKEGESNLFMPGLVNHPTEPSLGIKVVNIRPANRQIKQPFLQALYTDFDPVTGVVTACVDGGALTYLRTGASNGVAAKYLARED
ncbi:ornithine cyclodeaminase/mu-crystallin, partial [Kipferlia bialata]|eukprot:g15518.t1